MARRPPGEEINLFPCERHAVHPTTDGLNEDAARHARCLQRLLGAVQELSLAQGVDEARRLRALADATSAAQESTALYAGLERRVHECALALERKDAQMRHLSVTDELTGLYNRRGFYERAEAALAGRGARGGQCALVFIDVDGLKRANDARGHDAGDALLVNVARVLRAAFDASDVIARLGGDEFCVLRPVATDEPDVYRRQLQRELDRANYALARADRVSISVGVTLAEPVLPLDLDLLIAQADTLMIEDKRTHTAFSATGR